MSIAARLHFEPEFSLTPDFRWWKIDWSRLSNSVENPTGT
jgi:hypothetical protein